MTGIVAALDPRRDGLSFTPRPDLPAAPWCMPLGSKGGDDLNAGPLQTAHLTRSRAPQPSRPSLRRLR
jgi:hypothetical protein